MQISFLGIDYSVRARDATDCRPSRSDVLGRLMGTFRRRGHQAGAGRATPAKAEADRLPAWADPAVEATCGQVARRRTPTEATLPDEGTHPCGTDGAWACKTAVRDVQWHSGRVQWYVAVCDLTWQGHTLF